MPIGREPQRVPVSQHVSGYNYGCALDADDVAPADARLEIGLTRAFLGTIRRVL